MTRKRARPISNRELQRRLAGFLLGLRDGDRLPSTRDLAGIYGASIGSISNALESLQSSRAVRIDHRGRLGSFLSSRAAGELWNAAMTGPLVVGLTLASNSRYEGMATGLKSLLVGAGVEAYLVFIRGSRTRLKALREGRCHAVVMSAFAADELGGAGERILLRLPPGSFVSGHAVFYRDIQSRLARPLRVAIDRDSFDQSRITELEFAGQEMELVPIVFPLIHRLLVEGKVDAAVWTSDDMRLRLTEGIRERPLSEPVLAQLERRDTSAALVIREGQCAAQGVLEAAICADELVAIQGEVVEGQRIPEY